MTFHDWQLNIIPRTLYGSEKGWNVPNAGACGLAWSVSSLPQVWFSCSLDSYKMWEALTQRERLKLLLTIGCSQEEDAHNILTTDI